MTCKTTFSVSPVGNEEDVEPEDLQFLQPGSEMLHIIEGISMTFHRTQEFTGRSNADLSTRMAYHRGEPLTTSPKMRKGLGELIVTYKSI